ncbi:MAG: hypothetical protein HGA63_12260, partial [Syntrophobacteraceae bacterium]|nr:hypothetical protein [Syntrophobacteraceae bacterium]
MINRCLRKSWFKGFMLLSFLVTVLFQFPIPSASGAPRFEAPTNQKASDILPPQLLSGPHFKVRDKVVSYGYMHHYVVDSDFGVFEVTGDFALRKLIREIRAIAALREIKKSDAYLKGIKAAAAQPVQFGSNLLSDPVDTISGVPKGITRLFENVSTGLTTKADPSQDGKLEQALAVSANKRDLAHQLGVDVYSSNSVLQKELNGLAWATALGSLTLSAALAPVGGPAVMAVSATRTAQQVSALQKDYPPERLRQMNEQKLLGMGMSSSLVTQFLNHPNYTPTHDTVIANSLEALKGSTGRDAFLQQALSADDEETANFYMVMAETMRGFQQKASPIREIAVYGPLVFAKATNGVVYVPLPLDHGFWTERASQRVPSAMAAYKEKNPAAKNYEFWVTGTVSK